MIPVIDQLQLQENKVIGHFELQPIFIPSLGAALASEGMPSCESRLPPREGITMSRV